MPSAKISPDKFEKQREGTDDTYLMFLFQPSILLFEFLRSDVWNWNKNSSRILIGNKIGKVTDFLTRAWASKVWWETGSQNWTWNNIASRIQFHRTPSIQLTIMNATAIGLKRKFIIRNGILSPKLFWPSVRKKCSSDRGKLLKFQAEGQDFPKFLRPVK